MPVTERGKKAFTSDLLLQSQSYILAKSLNLLHFSDKDADPPMPPLLLPPM